MFYKLLENGKYRYFEKFYDSREEKWKQVTVTLNSKSRISQAEAKRLLAIKIDKVLSRPTKEEEQQLKLANKTFSQLLEEWKLVRISEIKPASFKSEINSLIYFRNDVGDLKLSEYTTQMIQNYLMGLNIANVTRKNRKIYLNAIFGFAERMNYIDKTPVKNVVIPRVRKDYEKLKKAQNHFISKEELGLVISYCQNHDKDIRYTLAMEFIFLTGLRFAEFIGVRYCDVDFDNRLLKVDHTIDYVAHNYDDRVLQTTKTVGSVRTIILSERCFEIIDYFKKYCLDEIFIFVTDRGQIMRQPKLYQFIKNMCDTALGEGRAYNIHMLRHSHISLLAELGVPIKAIMERVGHVDESITLKVYSHVTKSIHDDVRKKLNSINF
ncbi:tyrosine-type recombinase/integrase [Streptococcus parauberis]|uniref:Site-specific recombinase, phage integrase family n=1 Tax=Streptococcus parauberis NCFD 2020 TaxID=873447 RepID=F1YXU2_9STRE|nr:site-specific integrase [Streptococcus parauberis]EGE54046.1 site-specific recombinase, phage integrase family [Streptococcus parauberis NCFD 2020]